MEITYKEEKKERLDKFLQQELNDITRSQIKKHILAGSILVNNKKPTVHRWLKKDDLITYNTVVKPREEKPITIEPKIIEQTDDYVVLEKPHGLLTHPTDKGETNTLANWLIKKFPQIIKVGEDTRRPGIMHRLDKEASGLMVVALKQDSFDSLKKQFQKRTIKKQYTALVHNQLINDQGEITTPLERDKQTGLMKVQSVKQTDKPAHTTYEVITKYKNYSLVKVQIKTGRMHQIRAHFYSIGHSLVGDKLYQTKDLRKKKKVLAQRIFLHAIDLQFKNLNDEIKTYHSKLPEELQNFLDNIK